MKRIFVSFHHELNQEHANKIRSLIKLLGYKDISVNDGIKIEDEDNKTDLKIREEIRDKFLKNLDVIILIVGSDSINRKHLDWEVRSALYRFKNYQNAGLVVINCLKNDKTWILDKELIEIHDQAPYPAERKWPKDFTKEDYKWLPERVFNSISNNYDYESCLRKEYKHAIFPIIRYNRALEAKVLDRAINHSIEMKNYNKDKWDLNTKMRKRNYESNDRTKFDQYPA